MNYLDEGFPQSRFIGWNVSLPDSADQSECVGAGVARYGDRVFFSIYDRSMLFVCECNDANLNLNVILRYLIPRRHPLLYAHNQA